MPETLLRGLSLAERVDLRGLSWSESHDEELHSLLKQWKERLEQAEVWQERLAALGIGEAEFFTLGSPPTPPDSHVAWTGLRKALRDIFAGPSPDPVPISKAEYPKGLPPLPPLLQRYVETQFYSVKSNDKLVEDSKCFNLEAVVKDEVGYTLTYLHHLLLPALVTELHVAAAKGVLQGDSPEGRFKFFCDECIASSDWAAEFLAIYPVAVRLTEVLVRTRKQSLAELLRRFDRDYEFLQKEGLLPSVPAPVLQRISPWSGDRHREGRCVRILHFNNGRVVYKPRSVKVDLAFQKAVRWLNEREFATPLYDEMTVLARHEYGWFKFVESEDCADKAAVARFYRRQGAHLALLYLLGGHDFLAENVRAHGEYPILVDLECFLAVDMPPFAGRFFDCAAVRVVEDSVLRTGLLPRWLWSHYDGEGVDLSALTAPGAQFTPQAIPHWVDLGSDTVRQVRRRAELPMEKSNLPTINGVKQPVNEFIDDFRSGFCHAYAILQRQGEVGSIDRLLDAFAEVECRVLVRHTQDYHTLFEQLRHPRYLRDALRCSEFLDRLWTGECPRYTATVIESEIEQLWRGDIPVFSTFGASRDLFDDQGRLVARDYFRESGIAAARARLARLGTADLARQIEIIDGAFGVVRMPRVDAGQIPTDHASNLTSQLTFESLTAEAATLADHLLSSAIEDESSLSWIGVMGEDQWSHGVLDPSLYDGITGIGLLYLFLDVLTHEPRFERVWRKILECGGLRPAQLVLENRRRLSRLVRLQPGGFGFPFSSLYLGIHAAQFNVIQGLDTIIEASLEYAAIGLKCRARFDFVTGAAGLIRSLLVTYDAVQDPRALELARLYGDQLVAHAIPGRSGVGWPADHERLPDLLGGFSHGVSGIAWVLANLAHVTGDEKYLRASRSALAYDRTLFSADEQWKWKDLRDPMQEGSVVQWCHGPSGIGLSRVLLARYLSDNLLLEEVEHAIRITLAAESLSDCLCHGTLGNADICMLAAEEFHNALWRREAIAYATRVRQEAHVRGHWRSGVPGHDVGKLGLFMGTAGIAYALLRFARPDIVPSVLYLEGPRSAAGWGRRGIQPR